MHSLEGRGVAKKVGQVNAEGIDQVAIFLWITAEELKVGGIIRAIAGAQPDRQTPRHKGWLCTISDRADAHPVPGQLGCSGHPSSPTRAYYTTPRPTRQKRPEPALPPFYCLSPHFQALPAWSAEEN